MIIDFETILRRKKSYTTEVAQAIEEEYNKSNIADEMNEMAFHDHPDFQMIQDIYDRKQPSD